MFFHIRVVGKHYSKRTNLQVVICYNLEEEYLVWVEGKSENAQTRPL